MPLMFCVAELFRLNLALLDWSTALKKTFKITKYKSVKLSNNCVVTRLSIRIRASKKH